MAESCQRAIAKVSDVLATRKREKERHKARRWGLGNRQNNEEEMRRISVTRRLASDDARKNRKRILSEQLNEAAKRREFHDEDTG